MNPYEKLLMEKLTRLRSNRDKLIEKAAVPGIVIRKTRRGVST